MRKALLLLVFLLALAPLAVAVDAPGVHAGVNTGQVVVDLEPLRDKSLGDLFRTLEIGPLQSSYDPGQQAAFRYYTETFNTGCVSTRIVVEVYKPGGVFVDAVTIPVQAFAGNVIFEGLAYYTIPVSATPGTWEVAEYAWCNDNSQVVSRAFTSTFQVRDVSSSCSVGVVGDVVCNSLDVVQYRVTECPEGTGRWDVLKTCSFECRFGECVSKPLPQPQLCGNGARDAGEDCENCPVDLPASECAGVSPAPQPTIKDSRILGFTFTQLLIIAGVVALLLLWVLLRGGK